MRLRIILLLALAGCAGLPAWMRAPGLPADLARQDNGTVTGAWRQPGRGGYALSIGFPPQLTFAVQKGCAATGGLLVPLGDDRFRIERYDSGFAADGCGPWRATPELAPFDGPEVALQRRGDRLVASGGGTSVTLARIVIPAR